MELAPDSKDSQDFPAPDGAAGAYVVLGLESSCDETAAALIRRRADGSTEILADLVLGQNEAHAPYGGVVPEIAARAHAEAIDALARGALDQAGLTLDQIDGIAATAGPGLIGGVMAALMTAKGLALGAGKPLIAVNHLEGHALSPRLTERLDFPYLLLLVSGGHTQLQAVEGLGRYRRLGSTLDDAAGEAFDKTAKIMGLGYPGGPALERAAQTGDPDRFDLPEPLKTRPGCDFSFAGLKTAARQTWQALDSPGEQDIADLAAGVQRAIAASLARQAGRAMDSFASSHPGGGRTLVVAGGVAANQEIRRRLDAEAKQRGFRLMAPPLRYCTDNAAMIALAGAERLAAGRIDGLDAPARARWPLDEKAAEAAPVIGAGRKGPKA